ncbi:MAG: phosphatase PAP2 family protein [Geodermatophilaceae bacterium]|nr:phosphatase PAP2 family protein [Geodermatophilaceae bacterium]
MTRAAAGDRRRMLLLGLSLWLLVVLPLALLVGLKWEPLLRLDRSVVDALHPPAAEHPAFEGLLNLVTTAGTSWFRWLVLAPVAIWAFRSGRLRLGWLLVVAAGLIGVVTSGLKLLVDRDRPDFPDPIFVSDSLSHPSGHSSGVVTLVGLLLVAFLRLQPPRHRVATVVGGLVLVLAVGLTRIVLGAHYPSDVVAGFALGAGWVLVLTALFDALPGPVQEQPDGERLLRKQLPTERGLDEHGPAT